MTGASLQELYGLQNLWVFVAAGVMLNITPGPDNLYIIARSIAFGARAGIIGALGISSGCLVHVTAASLGLSAILSTSNAAFLVVKWLGAAYLVYVAIGLWRSAPAPSDDTALPTLSASANFRQGALTNILNPKVALFFLAFLPQFIRPDAANKPIAFACLGLIFVFNATLWCLFLAWLAARLRTLLAPGSTFMTHFQRLLGAVFVALAVRMVLSTR